MKIIRFLLITVVIVLAAACSNDDVDTANSIFPKQGTMTEKTDFDKWLWKNYTDPYNIRFNYLYIDQNSDMSYNVLLTSRSLLHWQRLLSTCGSMPIRS